MPFIKNPVTRICKKDSYDDIADLQSLVFETKSNYI